jgi:hypothetical protein
MKQLNNIMNFLKNNWYYIIMALMLVTIVLLYRKINEPKPIPPKDNTIEKLGARVDSLLRVRDSLQIAYDAKQATIINNITYKNVQDAKDISNIPNLTFSQRDSLWAKHITTKDSIPWGYWDILKQKTGGKSIKELGIQRPVQK